MSKRLLGEIAVETEGDRPSKRVCPSPADPANDDWPLVIMGDPQDCSILQVLWNKRALFTVNTIQQSFHHLQMPLDGRA